MKKVSFILLVIVAGFLLQACKSSKEVTDPKETVSEAPKEATEVASDETAINTNDTIVRTLFASIERTPCFGRCPYYKMTIYSDGFVEFNGIRDVEMMGKYTATITQEQMDAIRKQAKDIGFFEFDDVYDEGMISDLPTTTTTVVSGGVTKSVMRRNGHPRSLVTLEDMFDALMKSERWFNEAGEVYPPER